METTPKNDQHKKNWLNSYGKYAGLGIQMIAPILLLTWLGHLLDQQLQASNPWFTLLGAIVGLVASMAMLFKTVR
jgi:F0F1-type ATP synthase assembly protein I